MSQSSIRKFELIGVYKEQYGEQLHPELQSVTFCQDGKNFYVELTYRNKPEPVPIDMNLVGFEFDENGENGKPDYLFDPSVDFVDNTKILLDIEAYTLNNLIKGLFEEKASEEIKKHKPLHYTMQELEDEMAFDDDDEPEDFEEWKNKPWE